MILRASARLWNQPGDENPNNGFRCAQNLDRKASVFRKPEPERLIRGRFERASFTSGSCSRRRGSCRGVEHNSVPRPYGSESFGRGSNFFCGFAAKGKRKKNQANTSRTHRNPMRS